MRICHSLGVSQTSVSELIKRIQNRLSHEKADLSNIQKANTPH